MFVHKSGMEIEPADSERVICVPPPLVWLRLIGGYHPPRRQIKANAADMLMVCITRAAESPGYRGNPGSALPSAQAEPESRRRHQKVKNLIWVCNERWYFIVKVRHTSFPSSILYPASR